MHHTLRTLRLPRIQRNVLILAAGSQAEKHFHWFFPSDRCCHLYESRYNFKRHEVQHIAYFTVADQVLLNILYYVCFIFFYLFTSKIEKASMCRYAPVVTCQKL
jgi:hypothetical protein